MITVTEWRYHLVLTISAIGAAYVRYRQCGHFCMNGYEPEDTTNAKCCACHAYPRAVCRVCVQGLT